jgi:acetolactate synthase-1/2/3 large subunit
MNGVTAIANILKMEDVDFVACMPTNPLIEALAIAGIRPIVCRQERTGVHMADGFARITNGKKTGIFLAQNGPGAENAFSGVAQAYADSVPILLLPAGVARDRQGVHPNFNPTRSYETVTKWSATVNSADRVPELMRRAFTKLRGGRPGPVLLEIPSDVATEELDEIKFDYEVPPVVRTAADPEAVSRAAAALLAASRPLIHSGQGVLYAEASEELVQIAEFLQAPVMTTMPGKSGFPENHPLSVGSGGTSTTGGVHQFLTRADLVFGIGCSMTRTSFATPIPPGKVIIHATNDHDDINKDIKAHHPLLGDAKLILRQLLEEMKRQSGLQGRPVNDTLHQEIEDAKQKWLDQWMPKLTSSEVPLNPYRVIWDFMHTVDRTKTILTHDSGHPRDQTIPFYQPIIPRGYLGWGNSSQLGYSLGLSMGAKLAAPDKLVATIMGDAAIGMCGMDIETAARLQIPVLIIVLNNHVLSGYSRNYPVAAERFGFTELYGEYANVAKALGGYGERIEDPGEIVPAIKRAQEVMATGRPALLEFMTKEENTLARYPSAIA